MAVSRTLVKALAAQLGLSSQDRPGGHIRLTGEVRALEEFRGALMSRRVLYPTIIDSEEIDGVPTGDAPRIDVHSGALSHE